MRPAMIFRNDSGISTITYGGWTTANFAAGIDFGSERQYSVTAEVLNIFDKTYQSAIPYTNPACTPTSRSA